MGETESHRSGTTWDSEDNDTATITPSFLAVKDRTKEVDLFQNPTILSRLITNKKYKSAIKRVKTHPKEASVWVAMKRKGRDKKAYIQKNLSRTTSISSISSQGSHLSKQQKAIMADYTFRQLPLHTACSNLLQALSKPSTTDEGADLEMLINRLVVTFPEACGMADHEGKLPLHEAIWHNASPQTISMMLMACPSTIHQRDRFGRTPMDLNHNRSHSGKDKNKVKELLMRGVLFWERAREEAESSMQKTQNQQQPTDADEDDHKSVVSKTHSVASSIAPTSWIKLEKRALHLEQLLAEMYEKNYNLGDMVEELSKERLELQDELEYCRKHHRKLKEDSSKAVSKYETFQEKEENTLFENRQNDDVERPGSQNRVTFLEQQNASLGQEVKELNERVNDYETKMNRLELIVSSFREEMNLSESLNIISEDSTKLMSEKSAKECLNALLDALSTGSRFATEKFLAGKVTTLENRLQEEIDAREEQISVSSRENERLVRENAALQSQLNRTADSKPGKVKQRAHSDSLPLRGLPEIFKSDDLEEILAGAAVMYGSFSHRGSEAEKCNKSLPEKKRRTTNSENFVGNIEKVYGKKIPQKLKNHISASSLGQVFGESLDGTNSNDEPTNDDFEKIQSRVLKIERQYGEPIPSDLVLAINYCSIVSDLTKDTTINSVTNGEDVDTILKEAAELFGPINPEVKNAIRKSFRPSQDSPQEGELAQDDLEEICHEISKNTGKEVPSGLAKMLSEKILGTPVSIVPPGPDDAADPLERVFQNAAKLHGPIRPSLKNAMLESVRDMSTDNMDNKRKSSNKIQTKRHDAPVDDFITPKTSSRKMVSKSSSRTPMLSPQIPRSPVQRDSCKSEKRPSGGLSSIPLTMKETKSSKSDPFSMPSAKPAEFTLPSTFPSANAPLSNEYVNDDLDHIFSVVSKDNGSISAGSVDDLLRKPSSGSSHLASDKESSSTEETGDELSDFNSIIRDAEHAYGRPFDDRVIKALRSATFSPTESFVTSRNDDLSPEDELENIIQEAEKNYGRPFHSELKLALRTASLQPAHSSPYGNSDEVEDSSRNSQGSHELDVEGDVSLLDSIIRDAEQSYGKPIDAGLKEALRCATVNPKEPTLTRETTGEFTVDGDLQSIIEEAEQMYGRRIHSDLKLALRAASIQPGASFRTSDLVGDSFPSRGMDDDPKVESLLEEVERAYGRPFNSDLKLALRSARSPNGKSLQSIEPREESDELESIIRDAENMYGRPIQSDLKLALRAVSIQPTSSFRTLDLVQESDLVEGAHTLPDQRFDFMGKAAKMYSKPMLNEDHGSRQRGGSGRLDVGIASDDLDEIFSKASKAYETSEQTVDSTNKLRAFKPPSLYSIKDGSSLSQISVNSDDIDEILLQAAQSYSGNKKSY